jgi:hypothetical protein
MTTTWFIGHGLVPLLLVVLVLSGILVLFVERRPTVVTGPPGVMIRRVFRSELVGWDRIDRFVPVERPVTRKSAFVRPALRLVGGDVLMASPGAMKDARSLVDELNGDIDWRRAHSGAVAGDMNAPSPV